MKNAKLYLALYQNWETANAEELYRWGKALVRFLNVGIYIVHSIVKLAGGLLLNTNYLIKHHSPETLPEEIQPRGYNHQRWIS
jgi:hypothetical protein